MTQNTSVVDDFVKFFASQTKELTQNIKCFIPMNDKDKKDLNDAINKLQSLSENMKNAENFNMLDRYIDVNAVLSDWGELGSSLVVKSKEMAGTMIDQLREG
jgi:hypothetical protein